MLAAAVTVALAAEWSIYMQAVIEPVRTAAKIEDHGGADRHVEQTVDHRACLGQVAQDYVVAAVAMDQADLAELGPPLGAIFVRPARCEFDFAAFKALLQLLKRQRT